MLTKTKIGLAALLIAGTASAAMAQGQFVPNPANYAERVVEPVAQRKLRSAPVQLHQGRASRPQYENGWDAPYQNPKNWAPNPYQNWEGWAPPPAHAGGVG